MEGTSMRRIIHRYLPSIIALFCLSLIYILNYKNAYTPAVFNDEFGYMGNAATLAGIDWSSLLSRTEFYSIGYSLILVPLFKLGWHPSTIYRTIVLLNMGMLCISYLCALYIIGKLFPDIEERMCQLIGFVSVASCTMLFYSQLALCEVYLSLLIWVLTALFVKMEERFSYITALGAVFCIILIHLVHQRSIMLIPLTICLVSIESIKNQKPAFIIIVLVFAVICIVGYRHMKEVQIDIVYGSSNVSDINNVEVSSSFIGGYLTRLLENYHDIFVSLLCKLGVLLLASGFTLFVACKEYVYTLIKKDYSHFCTKTFIVLSSLIMLAMSSMQAFSTARKDLVVYSRYMDHVIPVMTLLGLCEMIKHGEENNKLYLISILLTLPLVILSMYRIDLGEVWFNTFSSPLWGAVMYYFGNTGAIEAGCFMITICLGIIISYLSLTHMHVQFRMGCFITVLLVINITAFYQSNNKANEIRDNMYENAAEVFDIISDYPDDKVYCIMPSIEKEMFADIYAKELQYLNYKRPLHVITEDELNLLEDCWLVSQSATGNIEFNKHCERKLSGKYLNLDRYHSGIYIDVPHMYIDSENKAIKGHDCIVSTGHAGIVVHGPYQYLEEGKYVIDLKLKITEYDDFVGTVSLQADGGAVILQTISIDDYLSEDSIITIPISLSVKEAINRFDLVVSAEKGARIVVYPYEIVKSDK